ncbi:hypothetical protein BGW36DRAFT_130520 [Talaromyces proteolyticus]|uniref:Uncharacterized protein n=1 Tax=Talaromyces proteolyticus TaxID=1131652 RepID=A0AAD4KWJ2_9EURO|nr:uncharacterized protein BGW36DRAFT_130520 [Talaromyces proteolyticus]KAH8700532.1 hypothetical protein BGW36DRAFT_130520 [Talaromyces proteolyticus]
MAEPLYNPNFKSLTLDWTCIPSVTYIPCSVLRYHSSLPHPPVLSDNTLHRCMHQSWCERGMVRSADDDGPHKQRLAMLEACAVPWFNVVVACLLVGWPVVIRRHVTLSDYGFMILGTGSTGARGIILYGHYGGLSGRLAAATFPHLSCRMWGRRPLGCPHSLTSIYAYALYH